MFTTVRKVPANDPSRFEGNGISYKAKLIGIEDVAEARGDLMCQEAMTKLKNSVKISGLHKRKIFVNVTFEGLRIIDAISLASVQNKKKVEAKVPKVAAGSEPMEQGQDMIVLHIHPVHRISFISRDVTDTRAFGYVFGTEDGLHKFFAIKTASAAESLVLTLRDLFQVVYQMKKKEVEAAKEKLDKVELTTNGQKERLDKVELTTNGQKGNLQTSGVGSTSGTGQTQTQKANAEPENIYQVPTNNAPISPETHAEQVANLLDLEDQAEHILKGIEQIKNLEFDSVDKDSFASPATSPLAKLPPSPLSSTSSARDHPWGFSANSSSSLGDLTGLQSAAFNQSFAPFPAQSGFAAPVAFTSASGGLPLTKDPFASDPFGSVAQQPQLAVSSGFGLSRPFAPGFAQPYGMQAMPQRVGVMGAQGMMPGMVPHGMMSPPIMGAMRSPFFIPQSPAFQMSNVFAEDPNILQPMKKDSRQDGNAGSPEPVKSPSKTREDLFGDLLNIRKSAPSTAMSPKDMFAQRNASERTPMNEMAGPGKTAFPVPAQNKQSQASGDPFGDLDSVVVDKTRGLLLSDGGEEDPFDTSFIPPLLAESSHHAESLLASTIPPHVPSTIPPPVHSTIPPPVPSRQPSSHSHTHSSSRSPMPSSPPPPPPPTVSAHHTPPPPPTVSSHHTPPPPPGRAHKPDTLKDINDNISTSPCHVHAAHLSHLPPSPSEPPPPLPPHIVVEPTSAAPPSPSTPRPHVRCTQTVAGVPEAISNSHCQHSNLTHKSSHTQNVFKANTCESQTPQPAGNSDVQFYISDSETSTNIVQTCNHVNTPSPGDDNLSYREHVNTPSPGDDNLSYREHVNTPPPGGDNLSYREHVNTPSPGGDNLSYREHVNTPSPGDDNLSYREHVNTPPPGGDNLSYREHVNTPPPGGDNLSYREHRVRSDKSNWVAFENCDDLSETPSAFIFSALRTNADDGNDDDPFNVPFHLTPGFKAVAKFGSDPFDDCLSEPDVWDPFCDVETGFPESGQGRSVNSPFGDPFLPAVQQATNKSLFD